MIGDRSVHRADRTVDDPSLAESSQGIAERFRHLLPSMRRADDPYRSGALDRVANTGERKDYSSYERSHSFAQSSWVIGRRQPVPFSALVISAARYGHEPDRQERVKPFGQIPIFTVDYAPLPRR